MEFELLKKSHVKRNIIIGVTIVLIISAVVLQFTRAKYRVTESIPLVTGTINYTLPDLNIIGLYVDDEEVIELDSNKEYTLDTSKSTCTYKDGSAISNLNINYDGDTKALSISPYTTKGTKCTLYFNSTPAITTASLAYNATTVNNTSSPNLIVDAEYESITYSITSGGSYASVNEQTGVVTGRANGTAIVQASITDKRGNNIIATSPVQIGSISNTNRFVWEQSNTYVDVTYDENEPENVQLTVGSNDETHPATYYTGYTISNGSITALNPTTVYVSAGEEFFLPKGATISGYISDGEESKLLVIAMPLWDRPYVLYAYSVYRAITTIEKGSTNGSVSSTSNSTYPTDAISGSYWYTYQGSDIIDPNSVTLSLSGSNITTTVNARSNSYGGTISYRYEYSIDGGSSWTTAATTSSTSYNISIPSNAKSMIVRVRAQDNYGFTSSTYIYSNGISIIN